MQYIVVQCSPVSNLLVAPEGEVQGPCEAADGREGGAGHGGDEGSGGAGAIPHLDGSVPGRVRGPGTTSMVSVEWRSSRWKTSCTVAGPGTDRLQEQEELGEGGVRHGSNTAF